MQFNYKDFLCTLFAQEEKLLSLLTLKVRAWTNPGRCVNTIYSCVFNKYSSLDFNLIKNITHSCTLTELDLAGNKFLKDEQENLNVCDTNAAHKKL